MERTSFPGFGARALLCRNGCLSDAFLSFLQAGHSISSSPLDLILYLLLPLFFQSFYHDRLAPGDAPFVLNGLPSSPLALVFSHTTMELCAICDWQACGVHRQNDQSPIVLKGVYYSAVGRSVKLTALQVEHLQRRVGLQREFQGFHPAVVLLRVIFWGPCSVAAGRSRVCGGGRYNCRRPCAWGSRWLRQWVVADVERFERVVILKSSGNPLEPCRTDAIRRDVEELQCGVCREHPCNGLAHTVIDGVAAQFQTQNGACRHRESLGYVEGNRWCSGAERCGFGRHPCRHQLGPVDDVFMVAEFGPHFRGVSGLLAGFRLPLELIHPLLPFCLQEGFQPTDTCVILGVVQLLQVFDVFVRKPRRHCVETGEFREQLLLCQRLCTFAHRWRRLHQLFAGHAALPLVTLSNPT